ncbi:MAG: hypothetical protein AABX98_01950 [Nanoarchaeota archaeon]
MEKQEKQSYFINSTINPYIENILGKWFKNIILLVLLIPTVFIVVFGASNGWIKADFGLQLFFLLLGIFIGKWLENGKS